MSQASEILVYASLDKINDLVKNLQRLAENFGGKTEFSWVHPTEAKKARTARIKAIFPKVHNYYNFRDSVNELVKPRGSDDEVRKPDVYDMGNQRVTMHSWWSISVPNNPVSIQ